MLHFWIIVLVQTLFLLYLFVRRRMQILSFVRIFSVSLLFGVIFGFLFDSVFGYIGLYTYSIGGGVGVYGTGLTIQQLILNGIFSYGVLVATVYFLLPKKVKLKKIKQVRWFMLALLSLFLLSVLGLYFAPLTIASLFLGGFLVISFGELLALLFGERGVFLLLITTKKFVPFVLFFVNCISVGVLYETVNYLFPFWVWLPSIRDSHVLIEGLVVFFGYVVVIHPATIFWQIMQKFNAFKI